MSNYLMNEIIMWDKTETEYIIKQLMIPIVQDTLNGYKEFGYGKDNRYELC